MAESDTEERPRIDPKQLNGYNRTVKAVVMQAVNNDGVPYRLGDNKVILYPPDGSTQRAIYNHADDRQIRGLQHWYIEHVHLVLHPEDKTLIEPPEEQTELVLVPVDESIRGAFEIDEPDDPWIEPEEYAGGGEVQPTEWVQHYGQDEEPVEGFVTNGTQFKCLICEAEGKEYITHRRTGIGGHRVMHTGRGNHANPEVQAKRVDSLRYNKLAARVREAIETLAQAADYAPPTDRLTRLEQENADLRRERDDLKAKLALLREAMDA